MGKNNDIISFLNKERKCTEKISEKHEDVKKIIDVLINARDKGNSIYVIGNGGSGSTASHFVSDLLKTAILKNKNRFKAISLVDNIPVMLAWSNDTSFEDIFEQQLVNYIRDGDVVIAFSGSGNSKNILKALKYCSKFNVVSIGFSGSTGGKMKKLCTMCLTVPSTDMLLIESSHVVICHCIISYIRNKGTPKFTYE